MGSDSHWNVFLLSLLKVAVLFAILLAAMAAIYFLVAAIKRSKSKNVHKHKQSDADTLITPPARIPAPGTYGDIKLYNTPAKAAALIMAIIASELDTPINELRFVSIRKVD